jgi:2'-hydroxyisoflavone reductase
MSSRRRFLKVSMSATGAALVGRHMELYAQPPAAPLRILILGGTGFIGPHLVRQATARGHAVTIFTRGRRDAELPSNVERLVGDRAVSDSLPRGNLRALEGKRWDVVLDDSATDPRWVRASTEVLRESGRYLFVSSTGVFLPYRTPANAETDPVIVDPPDSTEYGIRKAQSEQVVLRTFGRRGLVVRPGYIVGPGDTTDRFSYWPQRLAAGGEVLVPGLKSDPSQFVDVRDLTAFMLKLVEEGREGIYNATGPAQQLTFGEFIAQAHRALNPSAQLTWIENRDVLRHHKITYAIPWMIPESDNTYHLQINNSKAVAAGLTFRPIADTVRDTLADWPIRLALLPAGQQPNFRWITPEREREVLAAWKSR